MKEFKNLNNFCKKPNNFNNNEINIIFENLFKEIQNFITSIESKDQINIIHKKNLNFFIESMFNFLKISPKIIFSIDNFMLYTNTIPYIISIWNDEIQIFKIWKITFKLITLNYEIYNLENIQSIILLFFTSKTNQSIDFLKYINKKNNNFCNELINYWWNIIINIILPLYFYFPMKNSPSYKSNQKNLSNNLLLIFFEFFLIY